MRVVSMVFVVCWLSACGVETVGTAATAAALKKQEIEQGKKTLEQVQQRLGQANQDLQQRTEQTNEASK